MPTKRTPEAEYDQLKHNPHQQWVVAVEFPSDVYRRLLEECIATGRSVSEMLRAICEERYGVQR